MIYLWIGVCVAAAMACAAIRVQRPELATAVSLAAGAAVMAMLATHAESCLAGMGELAELFARSDGEIRGAVLRASGITVVAELAGQLCRDAGESALAGRVAFISRAAILLLCVPLLSELLSLLGRLSP